jgi:hypothetical protein
MRQEADLAAALDDAVRLFGQLASATLSFRAIVMVSASTRGDARPQRQTILSIASRMDIPEIAAPPEVASVREVRMRTEPSPRNPHQSGGSDARGFLDLAGETSCGAKPRAELSASLLERQ